VYRRNGYRLDHTGLAEAGVRDVSAAGVPLVATESGLYRLGPGWTSDFDGAFHAVAAEPGSDPGARPNACAIGDGGVLASDGAEWQSLSAVTDPVTGDGVTPVAGAVVEDTVYVGTEDGTLLGRAGSEWRSWPLGVDGVAAIETPE
jgi:hypothetical protein